MRASWWPEAILLPCLPASSLSGRRFIAAHIADLVRLRHGTARIADQMQIRRFCVRQHDRHRGMSAHCYESVCVYLFASGYLVSGGPFLRLLRGCSMTASGPGNTRLV